MSVRVFPRRTGLWIATSLIALAYGAQAQEGGFAIAVDGQTVSGDPTIARQAQRIRVAMSQADVKVKFDGLGVEPRLALVVTGDVGATATVQSHLNYPAYVTRGEVRVLAGDGTTLEVVNIGPNGTAQITVPDDDGATVVHRVYDSLGRYDQTRAVAIETSQSAGYEIGIDQTARRRIPVSGGAVTVYGNGVRSGARIHTLGTTIQPDPDGSFVVQRILPAGQQLVDVQITGGGHNTSLQRPIDIPTSEWFYVGTADVTFGHRFSGGADAVGGDFERNYATGRLAGFAHGKTQNGWNIAASVDTGEGDLRDILRDLNETNPTDLIDRLDAYDGYPTFGDDSSIVDAAPTNGKFYLEAEKNGNRLLWGNFKATTDQSIYLRNERTLYGAQGVYRTGAQTTKGEAKASLEAFAAQPDNLPGREIFLGTGGSVYFLQRQDISIGSDTLSVQIVDADTGTILSTTPLIYGSDYTINYIQGIVTLTRPLSGQTGAGAVVTGPDTNHDVNLVAQYEYTPDAGDLDGFSYGGRAQGWLSDNVRLGVSALVEQTDIADQKAFGADVRFEQSEATFVDFEYAQTEGPGFGSSQSSDGGLTIETTATSGAADTTGAAYVLRGQADLREVGLGFDGTFKAYAERRTAGFSTLDYETTNDEDLWGLSLEAAPTERLNLRLYYDDFADSTGKTTRKGGTTLGYQIGKSWTLDLGVETIDKTTPTDPSETGTRTDIGARATYAFDDDNSIYVFGQATVDQSGGLTQNDRFGLGATYRLNDRWVGAAEVSEGTTGTAARVTFDNTRPDGSTTYFGYELDPDRSFGDASLTGADRGQFVVGGKRKVSDTVDTFAENTADFFGDTTSLTGAYGVQYRPYETTTYSATYELGQISDPDGDFDRHAVSFGLQYKDQDGLSAKARLEFRQDRGLISGTSSDADSIVFSTDVSYKIDEERRVIFSLDHTDATSEVSSATGGEYTKATLGYAVRPVLDDRLNLLFKYTYLKDMFGQNIDGTDEIGPRQTSHVLSLDGSFDLNPQWTLGAKIGGRWSESSPSEGVAFAENDAWLGVVNARYHVTHKWDVLLEGRYLAAAQAGIEEASFLGAVYRHVGPNAKVGIGYNFGQFSDDLTDLTYDDEGIFLNLIAKF